MARGLHVSGPFDSAQGPICFGKTRIISGKYEMISTIFRSFMAKDEGYFRQTCLRFRKTMFRENTYHFGQVRNEKPCKGGVLLTRRCSPSKCVNHVGDILLTRRCSPRIGDFLKLSIATLFLKNTSFLHSQSSLHIYQVHFHSNPFPFPQY